MESKIKNIDLQLFGGGKGSSTTVTPASVPAATPEEREMQKIQLDYAKPTSQTALKLQDYASNMFFNNPGVPQVNYGQMGQQGTQRAYDLQKQSDALMRGELPEAYKQNRQALLNEQANQSLGKLLNNASQSGIINSSTTEGGMAGIADAISRQGREGYQQDLSTQANMLEQGRGLTTMPMEIANAAQNAAIDIPGKIFALGSGQQAPSTDAWKTMSNQRYSMANPQQTVVQQGGGGFLGSVLGGAAQGWACFPAGVLIDTPNGEVNIEDIKVGDEVIGIDGITVVTKTYPVVNAEIIEVSTLDGMLPTTASQTIMCDGELVRVDKLSDDTYYSDSMGEIKLINYTGRIEPVYDFDVEGTNLFYANGFIVEGRE